MSENNQPVPMSSRACGPLTGVAAVPGDKSISHRALILGAMAIGETHITGLLEGEDVLATADAMRALGAEATRVGIGEWTVHGVGVGGFSEPENVVDCGNSGTGVRLIMGAIGTSPISVTFTGDASLRSRPMARITDPLAEFGAQFSGRSGGRLPLVVTGAVEPVPIRYVLPMPSAQVKSAVLLAGLNAPGQTVVIESVATRDHTERMLAGFGAEIETTKTDEGRVITLTGHQELVAQNVAVPRDPSSAAFPVCAALMVTGSDISVPGVSRNPTRNGLFTTLIEMGANISFENERLEGGEPVADLRVRASDMTGVEVPAERAASMIDEFPILAVIAANATGKTVMRGVAELRVKECDRIDAMARGLESCGVRIEEDDDTLTVHGMGQGGVPGGGICETHLDHRIAMAFLCLGTVAKHPVRIDDGAPIATSFPVFSELMQTLGTQFVMDNR